MKSGEKLALRTVFIVFVGIVGFTIYLELDYRKTSPLLVATPTTPVHKTTQQSIDKKIGIIPKGLNPNDLPDAGSRGATLMNIYCAQCHELPTPVMHSATEWPAILSRMQSHLQETKKGMLRHVISPPKNDWPILKRYLIDNAQTSIDPLKYDDIETTSGKVFISTCSQCHAAPSPESHTQKEWPRVVLRMKSNMLAANIPLPEQDKLLTIIDFLQLHSKNES